MRILFVLFLIFSPAFSYGADCFTKIPNALELEKIAQSMNDYMVRNEEDLSINRMIIETFKWDKSACTLKQFLMSARESNAAQYNFETSRMTDEVRDYTGTFYKDYAFDDWFARPDVNIEKELYNYIYSLVPNLARNLKYMYYGISDGSTNAETGAIVFTENLETQYKIYFLYTP